MVDPRIAGLLSPSSNFDAGLRALAELSSQLVARGAPRLTPTPPPMNLGRVMQAYDQSIQNDLQRGLTMRQFERSEEKYKREQQEQELLKAAFAPVMEPVTIKGPPADIDGAEMDTQRTVNMLMPSPLLRELPANLRQKMTALAEGGFAGPALLQLIKSAQPRNFKRTYKQYVVPDGQGGETIQQLTATDVFNFKQQGIEPIEYEKSPSDSRNFQQFLAQGDDGKTYPGYFDTRSGGYKIIMDGKAVPLPSDFNVITKGTAGKVASSLDNFIELRDEIIDIERGLGKMQKYMQSVKDAGQGYQRLAQSISTNIKTFLDSGKLTKAELAQQVAKGQLQGLLGAMRIETVGPGVMTEFDALRVIGNLGGDVDALQNPEVVGQALKRLFEAKLARYGPAVNDYNAALRFTPRLAAEYKPRTIKTFNTSVFSPKTKKFVLQNGKLIPVDE